MSYHYVNTPFHHRIRYWQFISNKFFPLFMGQKLWECKNIKLPGAGIRQHFWVVKFSLIFYFIFLQTICPLLSIWAVTPPRSNKFVSLLDLLKVLLFPNSFKLSIYCIKTFNHAKPREKCPLFYFYSFAEPNLELCD